jgi:hypothetical protein
MREVKVSTSSGHFEEGGEAGDWAVSRGAEGDRGRGLTGRAVVVPCIPKQPIIISLV